MKNLEALEKFRETLGGQKLKFCFRKRNHREVFNEFIDILYAYYYADVVGENDDYGVDLPEEEAEEVAAGYTLFAIVSAGEYAEKLMG